ncbi:DMT family transporter [Caballeronia sp. LjRoot34]|uniref:EamA family transporter n=1 Tax=Caballeronia sp. LjRoot34 TaxID=3342325 RepID=UPI003ECC9C67
MSPVVIGLVLCAAVLHASWNAVLRTGADRLWSITVMCFSTTIVAIPFAVILPLPSPASWPYLIVSSCLQVAYSVFLVHAYQRGELGQVYPVIRGSVPLLVTLGAFFLTGQHPSILSLTGVMLVALGIMSLAVGKHRADTVSILLAFTTGLFIAGYTTTDAMGVQHAGNPRAYATWIFLIYGALMPATFFALRGKLTLDVRSPETIKALVGGVVSLMAYGAVISAFALGPAGPITALRETSIVFAALIGRVFLSEALTFRRLLACAVVASGALCVSYHA